MELDDLASIATIVEAIFVVISVLFIWLELRKSGKLARAANSQSLVEVSAPFNLQLIQDRQMAYLWISGAERYADMDDIDKYRYLCLLTWWLIHHENIYYQQSRGLLDASIYQAWESDLKSFVNEQRLWLHWDKMKGNYQSEFSNHVNQLVEEYRPQTSQNRKS